MNPTRILPLAPLALVLLLPLPPGPLGRPREPAGGRWLWPALREGAGARRGAPSEPILAVPAPVAPAPWPTDEPLDETADPPYPPGDEWDALEQDDGRDRTRFDDPFDDLGSRPW